MRKLAIVLAVAITGIATVAFAGSGPATGITGSMHDMNTMGGSYVQDSLVRSCVFCHTPHNASISSGVAPLWNRADIAGAAWTPYAWVSPANDAKNGDLTAKIPFAADPLIGPSRLCMSCHDGVTAIDAHLSATAPAVVHTIAARAEISDLTVTHPIGFKYADAFAVRGASELMPEATGFIADTTDLTVTAFDTITRAGVTTTSKKIADTLYAGYMTCASCHDVHNTVNAKPKVPSAYNYFLYARQEGSAICLSCHVK